MASFHYSPAAPAYVPGHSMQHGRPRRAPRGRATTFQPRHFVVEPTPKPLAVEPAADDGFSRDFEAAKSFDLEDDEVFCPFHLLTEDDLQSMHSGSGSDCSSLSSGSPVDSPMQGQVPAQAQLQHLPAHLGFGTNAMAYLPPPSVLPACLLAAAATTQPKPQLHQPRPQRTRNPIPIVDPVTGVVASPPPSVSPTKQAQAVRRW